MKKTLILLLVLALLLPGASAEEIYTDARGAALPAACPQRVVCLYGSFAEAWLEAGGTLLGVTQDAVEERALALPEDVKIVGTNKQPVLESIVALDPDLVIASADIANQQPILETLEGMGISCAAFRVDTFRDYEQMMRIFTQWTANTAHYETTIAPMVAKIEQTMLRASQKDAPTVLLLRAFSTGAKSKGADNLAGVMLQDLGCINIAERRPSLLEELTLETIVSENPDHIFITIMGSSEEAALTALDASLGQNPAWQALDAVRAGRVHVLPKELFHYKPNSRWAESYAYLYELLYEE